jgi:hypothetical protein
MFSPDNPIKKLVRISRAEANARIMFTQSNIEARRERELKAAKTLCKIEIDRARLEFAVAFETKKMFFMSCLEDDDPEFTYVYMISQSVKDQCTETRAMVIRDVEADLKSSGEAEVVNVNFDEGRLVLRASIVDRNHVDEHKNPKRNKRSK